MLRPSSRKPFLHRLAVRIGLLALVAAALAVPSSAAAALHLEPVPKGTVTMSGSTVILSNSASWRGSCSSTSGSAEWTSGTLGTATLTFVGCHYEGMNLTTPGKTAGTVVTSKLKVEPVYADSAKSKIALLFSPAEGTVFAPATLAGLPDNLTGSLMALVPTSVPGQTTQKDELSFWEFTPGVQGLTQVEGTGPVHQLQESGFGRSLALETRMTLNWFQLVKWAP